MDPLGGLTSNSLTNTPFSGGVSASSPVGTAQAQLYSHQRRPIAGELTVATGLNPLDALLVSSDLSSFGSRLREFLSNILSSISTAGSDPHSLLTPQSLLIGATQNSLTTENNLLLNTAGFLDNTNLPTSVFIPPSALIPLSPPSTDLFKLDAGLQIHPSSFVDGLRQLLDRLTAVLERIITGSGNNQSPVSVAYSQQQFNYPLANSAAALSRFKTVAQIKAASESIPARLVPYEKRKRRKLDERSRTLSDHLQQLAASIAHFVARIIRLARYR